MPDQPPSDTVLEDLASLEHEQWAHWTKYMLSVLAPVFEAVDVLENASGYEAVVGVPEIADAYAAVKRWKRQIETAYADLTEKERDSDREWARKVMDTVKLPWTTGAPTETGLYWVETVKPSAKPRFMMVGKSTNRVSNTRGNRCRAYFPHSRAFDYTLHPRSHGIGTLIDAKDIVHHIKIEPPTL